MSHIPVLKNEVLKYLDPKPGQNFIDATISGAGHAVAILEKNKPDGKVLGIEIDPEIYDDTKSRTEKFLENRLILINDSYANLKEIIKKNKLGTINGILFDLGMSSWHIEESKKGFSFLKDETLDMRYSAKISNFSAFAEATEGKQFLISNDLTAEEIINSYPEQELEKILREYGEEKFASKIAKEIIKIRKIKPIKTTFQLAEVIKKAVPIFYKKEKINPATRTFQALRIAVNSELDNLRNVLPQAADILEKGAKIVVISFHSLEDRIVKNFFKEQFLKLKTLTKKPITADYKEIKNNIRARSAKLRAAEKI